jgi:hypothetical protein
MVAVLGEKNHGTQDITMVTSQRLVRMVTQTTVDLHWLGHCVHNFGK